METKFTEQGLVNHCFRALKERWGYVWGTFGEVLTEKLLNEKLRQYPTRVGQYYDFIRSNWLNKPTADCIGLIKSYIWTDVNGLVYNSTTDQSADHLFYDSESRGPINSLLPNMVGKCVWKKGHVGVYVGDGMVIESRGTLYGVVKTPVQGEGSAGWTHWFKCPWLESSVDVKTYIDLLKENTDRPEDWVKAIDTAVAASKADGNLGDLEIFKFLPTLLEKIGNKK